MLKKLWLWLLKTLWGGFHYVGRRPPEILGRSISKAGAVHPDALPDESVVTRFKGMRNGPNSAAYKGGGGRKNRRKYENGYEYVGAKLRLFKNSGHVKPVGGVRCKRKSEKAMMFLQGGKVA